MPFTSKKGTPKNKKTYAKKRLKALCKKNLENLYAIFFYNKDPFVQQAISIKIAKRAAAVKGKKTKLKK